MSARPTAVNMSLAAKQVSSLAQKLLEDGDISLEKMKNSLIETMEAMLEKDLADNHSIGKHGANHIMKNCNNKSDINVLTHCNTGSLATAGYGTALGVVRSLHAQKHLTRVYCTETRPYNQGARLTSYELVHDNIPATLVCDSMVSFLMKQKGISAVVVGADRVAANGDTANKIGTYQLAIAAKHHNIPFYVAAPSTSIDLAIESGDSIPIEERPAIEMTKIGSTPLAAPGIECWNPAFDVTPAELITGGIITEKGTFCPNELADKLKTWF